MMIHSSYAGDSAQKVLIIDICDTINDYSGILLGVGQQAITEGSVDGTYSVLLSDDSDIFTIEVSSTTVAAPDGD